MASTTVVHLQAPNYRAQLKQLTSILLKYSDWNDFLSKKLHRFGADILRTVREHRLDSQESIARIAAERIDALVREILVSPLDGRPLKRPILERDWVWEQATHADCLNVFGGISPLDRETMAENPPVHLFAQEMLELSGRGSIIAQADQEGQLVPLINPEHGREIRKFVYQRLASAAISQRQSQQLRLNMELSLSANERQMVEGQLATREALQAAQARGRDHEAHLAEELDSIRQTYQEKLSGLNEQMTFIEREHQRKVDVMEQQIKEQDQVNSEVAKMLRTQLGEMCEAHKQEVVALDGQISSLHRSHKQLEAKIVSQAQEVRGLGAQVTTLSSQASQLQTAYQKSQQENAKITKETEQLQRDYAHAKRQIWDLQRQVEDADDSFCSIM